MEMEKRLYDAAVEGSVSNFESLIQEDPLILDRIASLTCFPETPLHISVLHGHLELTRALLSHNPSLTTESDSLGRLPLHLACTNVHTEIICELLLVGPNACLARDKDGKTPLHLAIMKGGGVGVVTELTQSCPESTRSRLDRGETVLHLCVMYNNLEALQVLVEDLGEDDNLLNAGDNDGNTIFHLASLHKHLEIMKYLLTRASIEVNAVNKNGLTALDLIENSPRDLKGLEVLNLLLESNAQRGSNSSSPPPTKASTSAITHQRNNNARPQSRSRTKSWKRFFTFADGNHHLEEIRGALIVGLSVLVAITVLPVMNMKVNDISLDSNSTISPWSLVPALSVMVLLLSGLPLKNKFCIWLVLQLVYTAIGILSYNYIGAMISNEQRYFNVNPPFYLMCVWFLLLCLASLLNTIRFVVLVVTSITGCVKRRKLNAEER